MQLAGCQRWHQTAGVRFATAAPNLANYLFPAFFLSAASRNSDGPNISPQYLQTETSRTGWRGPGCVTPAGPRWVTAAHSYRSAVRPTRANILRQETHSSFTCAKEHKHALLPFPLDSFDMVPSLCFALPSVASLPLFCAGMNKALLTPSSWPLHLDARLGGREAETCTGKAIWPACPPLTTKTTIKERKRRGRRRTGESAAPFSVTFANPLRRSTRLCCRHTLCVCADLAHMSCPPNSRFCLLSACEAGVPLSQLRSAARSPPAVRAARLKGVRPTRKIRLNKYSQWKRGLARWLHSVVVTTPFNTKWL